jgi:hypothetical protein
MSMRTHPTILILATLAATACTPQLVAPYNSDLMQKASSMQAEVATWDLTMRGGSGTIADDPRHPDVAAALNKWRGEADAMLTLAVSNDPHEVDCSNAAKAIYRLIEPSIPAALRVAPPTATAGNANTTSPSGCEAVLVDGIHTGIDDIEKALQFCRADWVSDIYFTDLSQNRSTAPKPPLGPTQAKQDALNRSCLAEFKVAPQTPAGAAEAQHGRAVSALLTTLQAIVYIENRKKAAAVSK